MLARSGDHPFADIEEGSEQGKSGMKLSMPEMPPATLLTALGTYNLLPAIVFLPTRRRCDQAAAEAALMKRDPNVSRRDSRREFRQNSSQNIRIRVIGTGHNHKGGVASHQCGPFRPGNSQLKTDEPAFWMRSLPTATVAAGSIFPRCTVVQRAATPQEAAGAFTASDFSRYGPCR